MIPLAENPTVRVYVEQSTGRVMLATNNISPTVNVEVVAVPDGKSISQMDERISAQYPYHGYPEYLVVT
jgi:hypothetical protein